MRASAHLPPDDFPSLTCSVSHLELAGVTTTVPSGGGHCCLVGLGDLMEEFWGEIPLGKEEKGSLRRSRDVLEL